jgi:hypothetical protein
MAASSSSSQFVFVLLANVALGASGCGVFGAGEPSASNEPELAIPNRKATAVDGPANTSELTNELGVFVATTGVGTADGTREHPLASIQEGIKLGTHLGKRVYVCTGTYREALVVAESISIIGGLDCTKNEWRAGAGRTRIEAPSSPAVRAKDIVSPTRLEGLDIVAPDATAASGSSIGLLAERASALVIARSKIAAGNAMDGADGVDGTQLQSSPSATGANAVWAAKCVAGSTCTTILKTGVVLKSTGAAGGTNVCDGNPAHVAEAGGNGGSGGLWEPYNDVAHFIFRPYAENQSNVAEPGASRTGAAGADGSDGTSAARIGTFSNEGYVPANGTVGKDGAPGFGGSGGAGRQPDPDIDPTSALVGANDVWRGFGGAGGGAGGCPGLAGTAGAGGGASIAALLIESALTFDGSELVSARGGSGGKGSFGSGATAGGRPGNNPYFSMLSGSSGGRGGLAGVSGNGGSGPSIAIAHRGPAPTVRNGSKATPGPGGAALDARSRVVLDVTKTIPATATGISKDILPL